MAGIFAQGFRGWVGCKKKLVQGGERATSNENQMALEFFTPYAHHPNSLETQSDAEVLSRIVVLTDVAVGPLVTPNHPHQSNTS